MSMRPDPRPLDVQRREYAARRFLAMPLAGTAAWLVAGVAGLVLPERSAALVLFIATGMISYLGIFLSRLTGENFIDKRRPTNAFDVLFLHSVAMAVLVYSIAVPFYLVDRSALPLAVGILTGLMWLPFSWVIQHWIGYFHTLVRTALVLALWIAFPAQRFVLIPFAIVGVYAVTIAVFERRWRRLDGVGAAAFG